MFDWRRFGRQFVLWHIVIGLVTFWCLNALVLYLMTGMFFQVKDDASLTFTMLLILLSMYFIGWSTVELWRFWPEVRKDDKRQ